MNLKCMKNGHDWHEGTCRVCGKKRQGYVSFTEGSICARVGHKWSGCACRRCGRLINGQKTGDEDHTFVDGSCFCQICGELRSRENAGHDWVTVSGKGDTCMQCNRCGRVSRRHSFNENRVCIYCGKSESDIEWEKSQRTQGRGSIAERLPCAHDWQQNVLVPQGGGMVYGKRCKKCGKIGYYDVRL